MTAAKQLRAPGRPGEHERTVVLNTGVGFKYPETVTVDVPTLTVDSRIPFPDPGRPYRAGPGRRSGRRHDAGLGEQAVHPMFDGAGVC